jgi:hypothetical protein
VALVAGDIKSGEVVVVVYDGTRFQVVSQLNSAGNATFANVSITSALNVGGVATFSAGTAAAPAITTTGDTNTGIFFPAADTIGFSKGGAEAMRIDSSGQVGIGMTPARKLDVTGTFGATGAATFGSTIASGAITSTGRITQTLAPVAAEYALRSTGQTTGWIAIDMTNTGGSYIVAGENSTGNNIIIGDSAYDMVIRGPSGIAFSANAGATQQMRLDSSGNLGIGTSSPAYKLDVVGSTETFQARFGTATTKFGIFVNDANNFVSCGSITNDDFSFFTNGVDRAKITSGGDLLVGKTTSDAATNGCELRSTGSGIFTANGINPLLVNRNTSDGTLVLFRQDNIDEGNISVSGSTVSYNGGHLSRYSQTTDNTQIPLLKGTVMTNLDQMAVWEKDGQPLPNEQLNCMKVSDVEGDVNVAGVFVNWDNDDDVYTNDMNIAMTGDMVIRVAQGVVVQRGELLMSAGDGTAKPQGDDIIRSKTVAKVTSNHVTCTYDDGSYCVPCVLMAC